jgi:RNA recognition motif-containing protein
MTLEILQTGVIVKPGDRRAQNFESRKPMTENAVRVSPLSFNVTEDHLKEIFGTCGKVRSVRIAKNDYGHSLQWGVIVYDESEMASEAVEFLNNGCIDGHTITVRITNPESDGV